MMQIAKLCAVACALGLSGCVTDLFTASRRMPPKPLTPEQIQEVEKRLAEYQPRIEASKLSYVKIEAVAPQNLSQTSSKFLGKPYWEKGKPYPKDIDGKPLYLLAQINFADVPKSPDLPQTGILQFYIQPQISKQQNWGLQSDDYSFPALQRQHYFRVIYHPEVNSAKLDTQVAEYREAPMQNFVMPITNSAGLKFQVAQEYIQMSDDQFDERFPEFDQMWAKGDQQIAAEVSERFSQQVTNNAIAKIGGYGRFVQEDPRAGLPDRDDWLVLLNIESGPFPGGGEILWGDVGTGTFFIHKDDLAKRDFSKVAYSWDNH